MTVFSQQVSVTTGAAIELTDGTAATIRQSYALAIINTDAANPVYLGPSGVTSATGFKVPAGGQVSLDMQYGEKLFARATGGTCIVGVLQSKF